jgi:hypothetical protein
MNENEETVEGLCGDHKYAREFIDVAHGRLKDFAGKTALSYGTTTRGVAPR